MVSVREGRFRHMDWAQLATEGATVLVSAVATDAWQYARDGFTRLLGRGRPDHEEAVGRQLEALATAVERAGDDRRPVVRQQLLPAWQVRVGDLLDQDETAGPALRDLVAELRRRLPPAQQQWVQHITASASGAVAQGVMFGDIVNHPIGEAPES